MRLARIFITGTPASMTGVPLVKTSVRSLRLDNALLIAGANYTIGAEDGSNQPVVLPANFTANINTGVFTFNADLPAAAVDYDVSGNLATKREIAFAQNYSININNGVEDFTTTKNLLDDNHFMHFIQTTKSWSIELTGIYGLDTSINNDLQHPIAVELDFGNSRIRGQAMATAEIIGGGIAAIQTYNFTLAGTGEFAYV